jgi:Tol biopolymer transport system component
MTVMQRALLWSFVGSVAIAGNLGAQNWPVKWVKGKPLPPTHGRPILYLDMAHNGAWSVIHVVSRDGQEVGRVEDAYGASWSPRGDWFSFEGNDQSLRVANLQGDIKTVLDPEKSSFDASVPPDWSPDGAELACATEWISPNETRESLLVLSTIDWRARQRFSIGDSTRQGSLRGLQWSPDGRWILISSDVLVAIDAKTGATKRITNRRVNAFWGPRGDAVYYITVDTLHRPALYLQRMTGGMPQLLASSERFRAAGLGDLQEMQWSSSHAKLAIWQVSDSTRPVLVFDLSANPELSLDSPVKRIEPPGSVEDLRWAPDESAVVAVIGGPGYTFTVEVYDFDTGRWSTVTKVWAQGNRGAEEYMMIGFPGALLSWSR